MDFKRYLFDEIDWEDRLIGIMGARGVGKTTLILQYIKEHREDKRLFYVSADHLYFSSQTLVDLVDEFAKEGGEQVFIDEIHRLNKNVEEILYPAMEDFYLDIVVGSEGSSRNIKINLPKFTLVGATTRAGDLSSPLRDRFGIISKLEYYTYDELKDIVIRSGRVFDINVNDDAAMELAKRSRKTPRVANRLFRRVRDFALVEGNGTIDLDITNKALKRLHVDDSGLDNIDREYLSSLIEKFNGGPVGVETIATSIGEEVTTIEDVVEPYLLQEGFIKRTRSGRVATDKAYNSMGYKYNVGLFKEE